VSCRFVLVSGGEALRTRQDLLDAVQQEGWHPWLISGAEEGRLAWAAVKAHRLQTQWVIDLGGGSLQITSDRQAISLKLGAAHGDLAPETWPAWPIVNPVFIGGTAGALAHLWQKDHWDGAAYHQAYRKWEQNAGPDLGAQLGDPVLERILPHGLKVLDALVQHYHLQTFAIDDRGLTEGLWLAASLGRGEAVKRT
ncbi:MAG: hypothetical protein OWS74_03410, partial [Firmicutes bacterium]|nr:hypothetical protein [Bacillota bacterium]